MPGEPDPPGAAGEQHELLARLRAVAGAKDAENAMLRVELAVRARAAPAAGAEDRRAGAPTVLLGEGIRLFDNLSSADAQRLQRPSARTDDVEAGKARRILGWPGRSWSWVSLNRAGRRRSRGPGAVVQDGRDRGSDQLTRRDRCSCSPSGPSAGPAPPARAAAVQTEPRQRGTRRQHRPTTTAPARPKVTGTAGGGGVRRAGPCPGAAPCRCPPGGPGPRR